MKKFFTWLDHHILTILTGILIVVIPLYPKLPLADLIEGYIVRLRLEDILIGFTVLIWFVQLLRKKIVIPRHRVAQLIVIYLVIGVLSSLSAIYVTKTVPLERAHLFKLALHLFRRFEYFSLFFIAYSGVKTKRDLKVLVWTALITLLATVLYGFGQKYLYWPAFSTMNREFSKGMRLYLTPTSRVMSTFGGHYDYAAYLMMVLSFLIPAVWLIRRKLLAWILGFITLAAYWSLILTASRASFIGYVVGLSAVAVMLVKSQGWKWVLKKWAITMSISFFIMLFFGDLSERFYQIVQSPAAMHKFIPWMEPGEIEAKMYQVKDFGYKLTYLKNQIIGSFKPAPPPNSISTDELEKVAVSSDIPPQTSRPLPPDVTLEQELVRDEEATKSATVSATTGGYSANALKYGLSVAIRLDALWPRAIEGFKRNPLLGSGYSTLTKLNNEEFTQAESTDNDYLRMIGETGILGTVSFIGILLTLAYLAVKQLTVTKSRLNQIIYLGAIGSIVAIMVNATYIDVFESSKVAYTLWIVAAFLVRTVELERKNVENNP